MMPEMSGRVLADSLRLRRPEVRIVFMSGYPDNVIAFTDMIDEAVPFVQKPFSSTDLVNAICDALCPRPTRERAG
ncbi:hypothetical protein JYT22_01160 [Endomicrobium sp. AH-315-J14]|nr:hypothetical protein [Endomicrobium sp. AH-315-J14]